MRSQWIDKATGKVINLSNYSYSQMSGWNGYQFDWSAWQSDIANNGGSVTRTKTSIRMTNTGTRPQWTIAYVSGLDSINSFRIRVSGLKPGKILYFRGKTMLLTITKDGIYTIPADASAPANFPEWESKMGEQVNAGEKYQYNGKLWKVLQQHTVQENWKPGEGTESLYTEVSKGHAGTKEDPIPYNNNMELENGKYYSQDGVTYLCTRDTEIPVYQALADLVGIYVEVSE